MLFRLTASGRPDRGFAGGKVVPVGFGAEIVSEATQILTTARGRILLAAPVSPRIPINAALGIARFLGG